MAITEQAGTLPRPTHGCGAPDCSRSTPLCCTPRPRLQRAIASIREVFRTFDTDSSGSIDRRELGRCLRALGANMTELDIAHMFKVRAAGAHAVAAGADAAGGAAGGAASGGAVADVCGQQPAQRCS